jgi:hypothetical protein
MNLQSSGGKRTIGSQIKGRYLAEAGGIVLVAAAAIGVRVFEAQQSGTRPLSATQITVAPGVAVTTTRWLR